MYGGERYERCKFFGSLGAKGRLEPGRGDLEHSNCKGYEEHQLKPEQSFS